MPSLRPSSFAMTSKKPFSSSIDSGSHGRSAVLTPKTRGLPAIFVLVCGGWVLVGFLFHKKRKAVLGFWSHLMRNILDECACVVFGVSLAPARGERCPFQGTRRRGMPGKVRWLPPGYYGVLR